MYKKILLAIGLIVVLVFVGTTVSLAEEAKHGGSIVMPLAYDEDVSTLDPPQALEVNAWAVTENIFEPILRMHPETTEIIPAIAESWEISDDGLEYVFELRDDVYFHNGRNLTAEDVKYTYKRIMDPKEATRATRFLAGVKGVDEFRDGEKDEILGIEVIDDYTIKITLRSLDVDFLDKLAIQRLGIVPEEEIERLGDDFGNEPVGSGPFKFVEWRRGDSIRLERFDDYYQEDIPYLDEVIFRPMTEASARIAAFEAGELDVEVLSTAHYQRYAEDPAYQDQLIEVAEFWIRNIHFNLDVEDLQDVRVRKAFNYAIDTELIVDRFLDGKAYPAVGWIPTSHQAFNSDLEGYDYNPNKAKELMEEAGFSPENPLEIEVIGTSNPSWGIPVVEAIMPFVEEVGFKLDPVLVDGATWSQKATSGDFEAFIFSQGGDVSAIDLLATNFWSENPRDAGNYSGYSNPDFDEPLERAMKTVDLEQRIEYIREAEEALVEDPPVWFYNYNRATALHQPWVNGLAANPRDMLIQPLWQVWLDEDSPRKN